MQLVEEELVSAVMEGRVDDPRLTPRERAVLRYADQMWHDHNGLDDELWTELMRVFSPAEFVELALSVAQNTVGQLFAMLGIPNPEFRDVPDEAEPGS